MIGPNGKWGTPDFLWDKGSGMRHVHYPGKSGVLRLPEHSEQIWALIELKAHELKDKKLMVERHLMEFYPSRVAMTRRQNIM